MRRAVIILATLGILAWAASQAQANDHHGHHGYRHGHHGNVGVYYGPVAPRVYAYPRRPSSCRLIRRRRSWFTRRRT